MGIYATKSKWQRGLDPIVALAVRRRVHPDIFTYGALLVSLVAAAALLAAGSNSGWLWLVPPCLAARLVMNLMDGQIARGLGLASAWGEAKNEFGDRVADAIIFVSLALGGYADARLAAVAVAAVLCVSYLGILAKAVGGPRVYAGLFGKGDRMISFALFTLWPLTTGDLALYNGYLVLATVAALVTITQRLRIIHGYAQST